MLGLQMCAGGSPDTPLCLFCGQPPPDPAQRHFRYDISTTTRAPIGQQRLFSLGWNRDATLFGFSGELCLFGFECCFTGENWRVLFFFPWQTGNRFWDYFFVCFTGQEKRCAGHIHRLLIPFRLFCTSASHTIFFFPSFSTVRVFKMTEGYCVRVWNQCPSICPTCRSGERPEWLRRAFAFRGTGGPLTSVGSASRMQVPTRLRTSIRDWVSAFLGGLASSAAAGLHVRRGSLAGCVLGGRHCASDGLESISRCCSRSSIRFASFTMLGREWHRELVIASSRLGPSTHLLFMRFGFFFFLFV